MIETSTLHQHARNQKVYIEATKVLRGVAAELLASEPTYEPQGDANQVEVKLNIPRYWGAHDLVVGSGWIFEPSLYNHMKSCPNARLMECFGHEHSYAKETAAQEAIRCLEDNHNIIVVDYNWHQTEDVRDRCNPLIEMIRESRNIYQYSSGQLFMVLAGIKSAAEHMITKDTDFGLFSCSTQLGLIYCDNARELQLLDHELSVFVKKQTMEISKDYIEYLKSKSHVSTVS